MCGRFTLTTSLERLQDYYGISGISVLKPRYNISPTQAITTLRYADDKQQPQWCMLRWGFIPSWMKEENISSKFINARYETIAEKPMFRRAFAKRRCTIPASGYYEWRALELGKQPYYITPNEDDILSLAGIWETWEHEGVRIDSCALLTMPAPQYLHKIHTRMPVIMNHEQQLSWIDPSVPSNEILQNITAHAPQTLNFYPVSRAVNNPKHDAEDCIKEMP